MTVVRELLIKIGFIRDKKTTQAVNKTIDKTKKNLKETGKEAEKVQKTTEKSDKSFLSFGRKLFLRTSFYAYAIKKYIDLLNKFVVASLDQRDLAKSLSLSNEELNAFLKSAEQFRLRPEDALKALGLLNEELAQARNGFNSLHRIRTILPGISLDQNENAIENFRRILVYLSNITDETSRKDLAERVFQGSGVQIARIAGNMEQFNKSFADIASRRILTKEDEESLERFEKAVINLKSAFNDFFTAFALKITPLIDLITGLFNTYNKFNRMADEAEIKLKNTTFSDVLKLANITSPFVGIPNLNVTNNIEVPAGTTEQQAQSIGTAIQNSMVDFMNDWIVIQNNNTRVE